MEVIDHLPVELDMEGLLRNINFRRLSREKIDPIIEKCRQLIEPKAVYTLIEVTNIEKDEVHLKTGHIFKSIILADMLEPNQAIVPYVVTIGPRLEREISEEAKSSILQAWVLEKMGDYALEKASAYIRSSVEKKIGSTVSGFGPGTGTGTGKLFGIEQQEILFQILNPPKSIGVCLTPSYLMVPRKSLSGIFAATHREYIACQYCPREKCESRRKPFSGEYYTLNCKHNHSS